MHSNVIDIRDRFAARRTLTDIDERGLAIRARNMAHAHGASRYAERCADHALNTVRMGGSSEDAIAAARSLAIQLGGFDGGSAA